MIPQRVRQSGDEGVALVLAIIFVLVCSVVVTAVVASTGTSIRGGVAIGQNRAVTYSLDSAVDGAVRQVRTGFATSQGVATGLGGLCDDYQAPVTDNARVTVSCQGEQGVYGQYDSGSVSPTVNPLNVPPTALQTYANTGEPGIVLDANGDFRVHGTVESTSTIRACTNSGGNSCSSGSGSAGLRVEGYVRAKQCIGDILTYGPPYPTQPGDPAAPLDPSLKQCPGGTASADPGYLPGFSSPPAGKAVPACPAGFLVTFDPGTYTNASGLNALTGGACPNRILWFKPGKYFFQFPSATAEWVLGDATVNVVGGTPFGWSPTSATRPSIPKADSANPSRHACTTEYDALPSGASASSLGVAFVFTGESRLNIAPAGGNIELCAQPSTTGQQIALYGMPNRSNEKSGTLGALSATGTAGSWSSTLPVAGVTVDGLEATGSTPSGGALSATFTGFDQLSAALPSTAVISKVLLKVAHSETSNSGTLSSVKAGVTAADGTALPSQTLAACTAGACTAVVDLTAQLGTVAKLRSGTGSGPSASFTLTASSGKVATEALDGVALDVYWLPKAYPATTASASPAPSVTNAAAAAVVDGTSATTTTTDNSTVTSTLTGFQVPASDVPSGSVITKVVARVVHKETNPGGLTSITLAGTAADASAITGVAVPTCSTSLADCTAAVDLTSSLSTVGKLRTGATGVMLTYAVKGRNSQTATSDLDGIRLEVTYAPDAFGTAQGCMVAAPYNTHDSTTCPLLRAQGTNAFVALHGTIYAPSSAVDLKIMNGGTTVFGRGALVRTLRLFFNPSVLYSGANVTIETPDTGSFARHDRIVDFWACWPHPNPDGTPGPRVSSCNDVNANLHVVASFNDTAAGSPVTYKLWSHRKP